MPIIQRSHVGKRLSQVAKYNGVLYLAGQLASDATQDISGQTRQVLESLDTLLTEHGSDKSQILFCQIFLADLSDFAAMNEVWEKWVEPGHTPPRATVETPLMTPGKRIEVVVTAAVAETQN